MDQIKSLNAKIRRFEIYLRVFDGLNQQFLNSYLQEARAEIDKAKDYLSKATAGYILLLGQDIKKYTDEQLKILGYMDQNNMVKNRAELSRVMNQNISVIRPILARVHQIIFTMYNEYNRFARSYGLKTLPRNYLNSLRFGGFIDTIRINVNTIILIVIIIIVALVIYWAGNHRKLIRARPLKQ